MPRKKVARNLSGLKNQPQNKSRDDRSVPLHTSRTAQGDSSTVNRGDGDISDNNATGSQSHPVMSTSQQDFFHRCMGVECSDDEEGLDESDDEEEDFDDEPLSNLDDHQIQQRLIKWAQAHNDDPRDEDWVPPELRRRNRPKVERRKKYFVGPVISLKAARTRRRYQKAMKGQKKLVEYNITTGPPPVPSVAPRQDPGVLKDEVEDVEMHTLTISDLAGNSNRELSVPIRQESMEIEIPPAIREETVDVEIPPAASLEPEEMDTGIDTLDPHTENEHIQIRQESVEVEIPPENSDTQTELDDLMDETIRGTNEIRPWSVLRDQIKDDLAKKGKSLPLSDINRLLIIRNFATLRIKGASVPDASEQIARQWNDGTGEYFALRVRRLARHYQIFEQLPKQKRGGVRESRTLLSDEQLVSAARRWLTDQKVGEVSPRTFLRALHSTILPSLNYSLGKPLSERTARRWLIKLGWRLTRFKKGVYMDGHEREDVVKYRQEVYLPEMAKYQARMAIWDQDEQGNFTRTPPTLKPGEKEVIPNFQDESCFAQNEYKSAAWVASGQTKLQKKGRGRLIHVSEYINPETGRLVHIVDGEIKDEARKIIYPGSNGDAWWDMDQMLAQASHAVKVFEKQFPNCVGLFIYDQSSAHGSLGPDALNAFSMNKADGGQQRKQRDTIIPDDNPNPALRGKVQKMCHNDGTPKGLETVLTERGFDVSGMRAKCTKPVCKGDARSCCMARLLASQKDFTNQISMLEKLIKDAGHLCIFLPKFHCELNPIEMYWGWAKYRYREVDKKTFNDAKQAAREYLDACPPDVIRRFINRTWRFLSAYRKGLTGRAAEWAVKKQSKHRSITERAMLAISALVD